MSLGVEASEISRDRSESHQAIKQGLVEAIEACLALGDGVRATELVESVEAVPTGLRSPYLGAQALRFRARLAGSDEAAGELFEATAKRFRELGIPFWLAVTLLEHGELTGDAESLDEAREIFERLEARPWLERLDSTAHKGAEIPA